HDPGHRTPKEVQVDRAPAADNNLSVLMGEDVGARPRFIQENPKDVRLLDILRRPPGGAADRAPPGTPRSLGPTGKAFTAMSDTPQDPTTPDDTPASDETPTPAQNVGVGGQETPDGAHEISEAEAASRTVTLVDPLDEDEVDRITQIDLNHEMQRSYLDYAMSVIVSRALPDVRDGLKPVHRRIVYAMFDGGYRPDRSFSKCAKVVGEVMGNY